MTSGAFEQAPNQCSADKHKHHLWERATLFLELFAQSLLAVFGKWRQMAMFNNKAAKFQFYPPKPQAEVLSGIAQEAEDDTGEALAGGQSVKAKKSKEGRKKRNGKSCVLRH